MRFEMFTKHEVELFALHINFFNLNEFLLSICIFFFFFFFFYELKLMYICLFTRAKSGREMTDCILSLPLMTVSDKHLYNISSKKEEKILQSLR